MDKLKYCMDSVRAYATRPMTPNLEALYTFDGTRNDLTKKTSWIYETYSGTGDAGTFGTAPMGQALYGILGNITIVIFGDFTLDFFHLANFYDGKICGVGLRMAIESPSQVIMTGFWVGNWGLNYDCQIYNPLTSAQTNNNVTDSSTPSRHHVAFVRKNNKTYCWIDGVLKSNCTYTNSSPVACIMIMLHSTEYVQNLRLISRAVQTSGTFPVPSTFYNGHESI